MFKTLYSIIGAAIVVLGINGGASAQVSDMGKIYPTFELLTVSGILTEAGVVNRIAQLEDGTPLIAAQLGEGKTVIIALSRCQGPNSSECFSLLYMAFGVTSQLPFPTLAENLVFMNFMSEWLDLAKTFLTSSSGAPAIATHLNADHGVSKGNILASLGILGQSADYFFGEMYSIKGSIDAVSSSNLKGDGAVAAASNVRTALRSLSPPALAAPGSKDKKLNSWFRSQQAMPGNTAKNILQNRAFQALLATEDFQKDFTYQVSE